MSQIPSKILQDTISILNTRYLNQNYYKETKKRIQQKPPLIVIYGGTGMVGKSLCKNLSKLGFRIRTISRTGENAYSFKQLGNFDQLQIIKSDIRSDADVINSFEDANYVIYAACGDSRIGRNSYDLINHKRALYIAEACQHKHINFIYFSTLQQDENSISYLARSCAHTEQKLTEIHRNPIIIRPSFIFDPEDKLFNTLARNSRLCPKSTFYGDNKILMQPIYNKDIADFICWLFLINYVDEVKIPSWFDLGGPEKLTKDKILNIISNAINRKLKSSYLPLSYGLAIGSIGNMTKNLPIFSNIITAEKVSQLSTPSIVSKGAEKYNLTIEAANIMPKTLSAIAPSYMWQYRPKGQFQESATPDWSR